MKTPSIRLGALAALLLLALGAVLTALFLSARLLLSSADEQSADLSDASRACPAIHDA